MKTSLVKISKDLPNLKTNVCVLTKKMWPCYHGGMNTKQIKYNSTNEHYNINSIKSSKQEVLG